MTALKALIASLIRKALFGAGAVWIAKLIEQGILTDGDVTRFIEIAAAGTLIVVPALWTYIKSKFFKD